MALRIPAGKALRQAQAGYAYVWALMLVLIMGIYLAQVGEAWQIKIRRDKEAELLRAGNAIRLAIQNYSAQGNGDANLMYPKTMQDLMQDPRVPFPRRFLRKAIKDPITGDDWLYMSAPGGGFMGVYSKSSDKPLKTANFPDSYQSFSQAQTYQDWKFVVWPNRGGSGRR